MSAFCFLGLFGLTEIPTLLTFDFLVVVAIDVLLRSE